jgi:GGDEF domain-containing protein
MWKFGVDDLVFAQRCVASVIATQCRLDRLAERLGGDEFSLASWRPGHPG